MTSSHRRPRCCGDAHLSRICALLICSATLGLTSCIDRESSGADATAKINEQPQELGLPPSDPLRGRRLFVTKGCFICHAVRGAGGTVAPALDAPYDGGAVDPMVFAAGMWRGAGAMLSLQLMELGYQIDISGDELRDLAAFASDPKAQAHFSLEGLSEFMQEWMIDEPYWLKEDWPERFEQPPEGAEMPYDDL